MTICTMRKKENFEISKLTYPKYVNINETFEISYQIKNLNWLFPGDYITYLYHNGSEIFKDNRWLDAGNEAEYVNPILLSEPGLHSFHVSVLDDKLLKNECEDYINFTITVLEEGESKTTKTIMDYWYLGIIGVIGIYLWSR